MELYIPPLIPFFTISNTLIPVKRSSFALFFLKLLAKLILGQKEILHEQVRIF